MFLVDWIKAEAYFFNHNEILQYSRLIKYDDKISKKNGGGLYWSTNFMALAIKNCMIVQNDDPEDMAEKLSLWLAIRLRYTNDEVIKLMKDFYNNEYHYDYVLYGMRIFDVMKNNCLSYPEAILLAYEMGTNFKETKMLSRYFKGPGHGLKMKYAYDFTEVGKIKYDFNRYHRLIPNLTVEQHEELMEIVRTSSIKIAKEMGIITSDDEFDGLNLGEYKELKARLVKNEKQILIDRKLWSDKYNYDYLTDEELAGIDKRIEENLKKISAKQGLKFENNESFDNFKSEKYKELTAKLIKNEKQILIDKGLWKDEFEHKYWTDEEKVAKQKEFYEHGKKILIEQGIWDENDK